MKLITLTNPGLEKLCRKELKELINVDTEVLYSSLLFKTNKNNLHLLARHLQSARRLLFSLGKYKDLEKINFKIKWKDFFTEKLSIKIEVENVKGQINREEIAKKVGKQLFLSLEEKNIAAKIDYKNPYLKIIVFHTGKEYLIGIDLCGELNSRDYRVFAHSASFKGDLGYYILRKANFLSENNLLVGFVRDGTIAIEAALFANRLPLHLRTSFDFQKFQLFKNTTTKLKKAKSTTISAFDPAFPNFIAARKNAKLAGVDSLVKIIKCQLDDLDVKFNENTFNQLIFQITSKDESKLNEIYYQANYILKKKGTLLLIGREKWEPSISNKFKLVNKEKIQRGESIHLLWLLEKK